MMMPFPAISRATLPGLQVDFLRRQRYSEFAMRSLNLHHGHHHHHHAQSVLAAMSGVAK
jgi:hypothetical protein